MKEKMEGIVMDVLSERLRFVVEEDDNGEIEVRLVDRKPTEYYGSYDEEICSFVVNFEKRTITVA